ncbi:hypothetical protein GEMRC1_003689 [Eukaryota sp. GEM-RC1]
MPSITCLAILQPGRGKNAWDNVLAFVPETVPSHVQDNIIRLSLGVAPFMSTFTNEPISSITCASNHLVFWSSSEYIFVAVLSSVRTHSRFSNMLIQSLLGHTFNLMSFALGPLCDVSSDILKAHFSRHIERLITPNIYNVSFLFSCYQTLRLTPQLGLAASCVVSRIVDQSDSSVAISAACLLHHDKVIHSTLSPADTVLLFHFLKYTDTDVIGSSFASACHSVIIIKSPLHLSHDHSPLGMVMIKTGQLTSCFFSPNHEIDFLEGVASFITNNFSTQLLSVSKGLMLNSGKRFENDDYAFVLFDCNTHVLDVGMEPFSLEATIVFLRLYQVYFGDSVDSYPNGHKSVIEKVSPKEWIFVEKELNRLFVLNVKSSSNSSTEIQLLVDQMKETIGLAGICL